MRAIGLQQPLRLVDDPLEHLVGIPDRRDSARDLTKRPFRLGTSLELGARRGQLVDEPAIGNGDRCVVGEQPEELDVRRVEEVRLVGVDAEYTERLAIGDEELDVVDLMACVVDGVRTLRHAQRVELLHRFSARRHGWIGDDAHVNAACLRGAEPLHHIGPPKLIHLDQQPALGRAEQPADQGEDAGILPEPYLARGELAGGITRPHPSFAGPPHEWGGGRARAAAEGEEEEQADHSNHSGRKLRRTDSSANPAC